MYVYMYVCMYVCIYVCMYVCMYMLPKYLVTISFPEVQWSKFNRANFLALKNIECTAIDQVF